MASQQSGGNGNQQFRLSETFTTEEYKTQIKNCLEGQHQNSLPFPHFVFTNFVSNSALIADLRKELQNVAWVKKCNDLYSLNQTVDLGDIQAAHYPMLSSFRHFMMTEVRQWLAAATGVQLSEEKLAITGSRYASGDCLLPHDDRLEGRAFAFVLYLTAGWEEADGGALCLYDSDPVQNHPTKVAKRIQPVENSLSLFRVQHNSWHSVEEVISEKQRLSLNGWFHYAENAPIPPLGPGPTPEEPFARIKPTMDITLAEVNAWLNANYVKPGQHKQIKRIFAYKSELSLQQFLNANRYNQALAELEAAEFEQCGPPNKRNVWQLTESKLAEGSVLRSLLRLFRSEAITLLLTQWTGLHLYDLNKKPTAATGQEAKEGHEEEGPPPEKKTRKSDEAPTATTEGGIGTSETTKASSSTAEQHKDVEIVSHIYRFERGCYSMADDQMAADAKNNGFCLDLMLFFGRRPEWPSQFGGFSSFFAIGENEEIMRVNPTMNTAAIVFREPEVLNFTKYVNHRAGADHFFVLNCSFFGISSGESESESSLESEEEEETPPEEEEEFDEEDEPEGEDGNQQEKGNGGGQPESTSAAEK